MNEKTKELRVLTDRKKASFSPGIRGNTVRIPISKEYYEGLGIDENNRDILVEYYDSERKVVITNAKDTRIKDRVNLLLTEPYVVYKDELKENRIPIISNEDIVIDGLERKNINIGMFLELPAGYITLVAPEDEITEDGIIILDRILPGNTNRELTIEVVNASKEKAKTIHRGNKLAELYLIKTIEETLKVEKKYYRNKIREIEKLIEDDLRLTEDKVSIKDLILFLKANTEKILFLIENNKGSKKIDSKEIEEYIRENMLKPGEKEIKINKEELAYIIMKNYKEIYRLDD